MAGSLRTFYQTRYQRFADDENRSKQSARLYATGRLAAALLAVVACWQAVSGTPFIPGPGILWIILGPVGLVLFIFMVSRHMAHRQQQRYAERLIARSEEHTSELQSLLRISYAVFCLKKKIHTR